MLLLCRLRFSRIAIFIGLSLGLVVCHFSFAQKIKYNHSSDQLEKAAALYKAKAYEECLEAYSSIIEKALNTKHYEEAVFALEKKGNVLRLRNRNEKAIQTLDYAIKLASSKLPQDHILLSKVYYRRGIIDHRLLRYRKAKAYFDTALVKYDKASAYDSSFYFNLIEYKYYACEYLQESYDTLLTYLNKLVVLETENQKRNFSPNKVLELMSVFPNLYIQQGDYERALAQAVQAYQYAQNHRKYISPKYLAEVFFDLGTILYLKEDYHTAIKAVEEIMPLIEETPRDEMPEYYAFYNLLGANYQAVNKHELALECYRKALELPNHLDNGAIDKQHGIFKANVKVNIARCHQDLKDLLTAKTYFDESLKEFKNVSFAESPDLRTIYKFHGNYFLFKKDWQRALLFYDSALRSGIHEYTSSIKEFPKVKKEAFSRDDMVILAHKATSLYHHAIYQDSELSGLIAAENYVSEMHEVLSANKEQFLNSSGKLFMSKDFKELYETGTGASLALYKKTNDIAYFDRALTHMAQGKSQLLIEQIGLLEAVNNRLIPHQLKVDLVEATQKLDSLEESVSIIIAENPLDNRLSRLLKQQVDWSDRIKTLKKEVASLSYSPEKKISVEGIRQDFDINSPGKIFIEYLDADSIIYAAAISNQSQTFHKIVKDSAFTASIETLLREISSAPATTRKNCVEKFSPAASLLYKALIEPFTTDLGEINELIIVPDEELNNLPFELFLKTWKGTESRFKELDYLMKGVNVTHLLSSKMSFQNSLEYSGKGIIGFGYSGTTPTQQRAGLGELPGAFKEIQFLRSNFLGDFFTGKRGTKQKFLKEAGQYDIIHLAIHGKSDPSDRFRSSLVFNGEDDYNLTASDLYSTDLRSKLAVLSACETGIGKVSEGEGTFSIARGFAIAGVPAIVTTLWKVNDISGSKISRLFYENLEKGMDKAEALRQAKIQYLSEADNLTESPFYWGNYILIGDPEPIMLKKKAAVIWKWPLALLFVCIAAGFIVQKRKRVAKF